MTISEKRFKVVNDEFLLPTIDFVTNTLDGVINQAQDFYDVLQSEDLKDIVDKIKASDLKALVDAAKTGKIDSVLSKYGVELKDGLLSLKKKDEATISQTVNNYTSQATKQIGYTVSNAVNSVNDKVSTAINGSAANIAMMFDVGNYIKNTATTVNGAITTLTEETATSVSSFLSELTSGKYNAVVHDAASNISYLNGLFKTAAESGLRDVYTTLAALSSDETALKKIGISKNDLVISGIATIRDAAKRGDVNTVIEIASSSLVADIRATVPTLASELYDLFPTPGEIPESQIDAYYQKLKSALTVLDPNWSSAKAVTGYFDQKITKNISSFPGLFPISTIPPNVTFDYTIGDPSFTKPEVAASVIDSVNRLKGTDPITVLNDSFFA